MVKNGFKGQIVTTFATADLCDIMLRDSAHIQEFEAEWRNRKARRSGEPLYEPLYTMQDAQDAVELLAPCDYEQRIELCKGVEVRFTDIGHLLGSAVLRFGLQKRGYHGKLYFQETSEISISRLSKTRNR